MRRAAVDYATPLLTNMNLVEMFTNAVYKHRKEDEMTGLEPKTLFEHYKEEDDTDAWSSPSEFH